MDRSTAVKVIKQIFARCNHSVGKTVKLMPPDANSVLSNGHQIHVEVKDDDYLHSCIEALAKEIGLTVQKEDDFLVIYKPLATPA